MRYFFDKGRESIKYTLNDPAGYGDNIAGLQGITVQDAVTKFETAYNRAIKAEGHATRSYVLDATDEWRKIFGDYFPTYG